MVTPTQKKKIFVKRRGRRISLGGRPGAKDSGWKSSRPLNVQGRAGSCRHWRRLEASFVHWSLAGLGRVGMRPISAKSFRPGKSHIRLASQVRYKAEKSASARLRVIRNIVI